MTTPDDPNTPLVLGKPRLLDQAIAQLDTLPEGVNLGVHATQADGLGAEIAGKVKVGKNVTLAGDATWYQRAGYTVMGWIGWAPK